MRIRTETPASVLIEADRAAGPVAMTRATAEAMRKARGAGIGLALARATTHTAALGYYTVAIAREGMAGSPSPGRGPTSSTTVRAPRACRRSPISIAVPGGEPVVLDMATSVVSMGKLNQAKKSRQPIPEGWALDAGGKPTTDPKRRRLRCRWQAPKVRACPSWSNASPASSRPTPCSPSPLEGTPEGSRHRQNGFVMAIDLAQFGDPLASNAKSTAW